MGIDAVLVGGAIIAITQDGRTTVLTLDSTTAGALRNLLFAASPVGGAECGALRVRIVDDGAPPPEPIAPHKAVEEK